MAKPDPEPCRPEDVSKFEQTKRDGSARIGKFHTSHGIVNTPALLPVINPNIQTIPAREMWEDFGVEMLITNSYIIRGKEELQQAALEQGVHGLLDFPGAVMTDSGTFQSYVYGEVEVSTEEIVAFQRSIGVDVATMLDVFGRPDMNHEESAKAVRETAARAEQSLAAARATMLNGPIQGGVFADLRTEAALSMSEHNFAVHPIGGIVPLMEQRRYRELVEMISACRHLISPERPVHLFGCGHPHLFPLAVALGVDLFDSAAYALFARDGRMIVPWGTLKLDEVVEWPIASRYLCEHSPSEVRAMDSKQREGLLARFNLEVTLAELARAREAVRQGCIWELVERRAAEHPALGEAVEFLLDSDSELSADFRQWLITSSNPLRSSGVLWSEGVASHPWAVRSQAGIISSWKPPSTDSFDNQISDRNGWNLIIIDGVRGPWRERCGIFISAALERFPATLVLVQSPLGPIPYSLEDVNPFSHFTGPQHIWNCDLNQIEESEWKQVVHIDGSTRTKDGLAVLEKYLTPAAAAIRPSSQSVENYLRITSIRDKLALFAGLDAADAEAWLEGCSFVMSSTGRAKNVIDSDGIHILSPRLNDGGLSLTIEGAEYLHRQAQSGKCTIPVLVMYEGSEPFLRAGRNAMHGFIIEVKGELTPGLPCLLESEGGQLLAHGISRCTNDEAMAFKKGIAVRVKAGIGE